jgi:integrase
LLQIRAKTIADESWQPKPKVNRAVPICTDAGPHWSCLDFRHTFGSQLAQAGVSLFKIVMLMGNSPEIGRRHYAAITPISPTTDVDFRPRPDPALSAANG